MTFTLARCFIVLSLIYLVQTLIAYFTLDKQVFKDYFANSDYAEEIYGLTHSMCVVNMIHAATLVSLGVFVTLIVRKFQILNSKHYKQLGFLTVLITIIYFLPLVFLAYKAWTDATMSTRNAHKGAFKRFADMLIYLLLKSEQGLAGTLIAAAIHFCLYLLVFGMLWCTYQVKELLDYQRKIKQMQGGSYAGLELHGISEVMETQENDDLNASGSLELPSPTIESLDGSKEEDEEEKTETSN